MGESGVSLKTESISLLFLSPLLLFVPPLIPVDSSLGLALLDGFFKGMFVCHSYTTQIGSDGWDWLVLDE